VDRTPPVRPQHAVELVVRGEIPATDVEAARAEMDMLIHRFLYFLDARDGRGRVLYLRVDGDYGLVQPW
jgi:Sigma 54 modulation/S30EA ribosomal protein C terminus